ncbi:MAG TPA: thiamine pyrophosphate-dependent enzyme [Syntrophorhabdales bacterium]|nr:thiamine pyrophosphate-dependent enzyme [Syntrophorhabdales bacterium]
MGKAVADEQEKKSEGRTLLSGNEAFARGAYEAGVVLAAAYPGTPSSEIMENVAQYKEIIADWAANEKTAFEICIGAAMAGARTMASMKQPGVSVCLDALLNWSHTGTPGGFVLVACDDPGQHSSQTEDDTRMYAKLARVPCLDPSDSMEAKEFVGEALALSEKFDTPVIVKSTTRISHSKTIVDLYPRTDYPVKGFERNPNKYVVVPGRAILRETEVIKRLAALKEYVETSPLNRIEWNKKEVGIITSGIAYYHAKHVMPEASYLKLGISFPLPEKMIKEFASNVKKLVVIEETRPFFEEELKIMGIKNFIGMDYFRVQGELSADVVRDGLKKAGIKMEQPFPVVPQAVDAPPRPPVMCPGCPHRGIFLAFKKIDANVYSDIGCYTLAFAPPINALHTAICMGASIGNAVGMAKVKGSDKPIIAAIGDGTFVHSGLTPLYDAVYSQANVTIVILDNRITAMTGGQPAAESGFRASGSPTVTVDLEKLVAGFGVKFIKHVDPYDIKGCVEVLKEAIAFEGPAVVITNRPCALMPKKIKGKPYMVDAEKCTGCGVCMTAGCPAVGVSDQVAKKSKKGEKARTIDPVVCTGCSVCQQVCAVGAIQVMEN